MLKKANRMEPGGGGLACFGMSGPPPPGRRAVNGKTPARGDPLPRRRRRLLWTAPAVLAAVLLSAGAASGHVEVPDSPPGGDVRNGPCIWDPAVGDATVAMTLMDLHKLGANNSNLLPAELRRRANETISEWATKLGADQSGSGRGADVLGCASGGWAFPSEITIFPIVNILQLVAQYANIAEAFDEIIGATPDGEAFSNTRLKVDSYSTTTPAPLSGDLSAFSDAIGNRGLRDINPHLYQLADLALPTDADYKAPHIGNIGRSEDGTVNIQTEFSTAEAFINAADVGEEFRREIEDFIASLRIDDLERDLASLQAELAELEDLCSEVTDQQDENWSNCQDPGGGHTFRINELKDTLIPAKEAEIRAARDAIAAKYEEADTGGAAEERQRARGRWDILTDTARDPYQWKINRSLGDDLDLAGPGWWNLSHLFSEMGYIRGGTRARQGLDSGEVNGYQCVVGDRTGGNTPYLAGASSISVRSWVDSATREQGALRATGGGQPRLSILPTSVQMNVGRAAEQLFAAWMECLSVALFYNPDISIDRVTPQLSGWNGTEGIDFLPIRDAVKGLLNANIANLREWAGDAYSPNRHFYDAGDVETASGAAARRADNIVCGGVFGAIHYDQAEAYKHQIAPLCLYTMGTDAQASNPTEFAAVWVANMGLWVNRTAMSGIVWVTRQVYSFGLAEDAIGGLAVAFQPLRNWLVRESHFEGETGEERINRLAEWEERCPEDREWSPEFNRDAECGWIDTLREQERGATPLWLFWGGAVLAFFVAYQIIRGRGTVAAKEVLISLVAGTLLWWMVDTELRDPGSWYRSVGGAAISAVRSVASLSFGGEADDSYLTDGLYYRVPENYYSASSREARLLRWLGGCPPNGYQAPEGSTWAAAGWRPAAISSVNLDEWCKSPDKEDLRLANVVPPPEASQRANWIAVTSSPNAWSYGRATRSVRGREVTAADWENRGAAVWGALADTAHLRTAGPNGEPVLLAAPELYQFDRGTLVANEVGTVLGSEVLTNMYFRAQWGDSLEGPEWRWCRERAWAALMFQGSRMKHDGARRFFEFDFAHNRHWPAVSEPLYKVGGWPLGDDVDQRTQPRGATTPCGLDEGAINDTTPEDLRQYNHHMPAERTLGPWIAAIPTVTLFAAVLMNAVPVVVAQLLLVVLFALLPAIALVAIMPGKLREGLYKWVGHILRAVLTILFSTIFIVLAIWILKGVYLLPGSGIWQDLIVGIAGAVAVWKLRGGLWRGATTVAAKAAGGIGKLAGAKGEVTFKGDKLGEKYLRNRASEFHKKRQDWIGRYEAGKGRVMGAGFVAGQAAMAMGGNYASRSRRNQMNLNKAAHLEARGRRKAMDGLRTEMYGMKQEEWDKHRANGFQDLRRKEEFAGAFYQDGDGSWQIRGDASRAANLREARAAADQARGRLRDEETQRRTNRYAGRGGLRRANLRAWAGSYQGTLQSQRGKGRMRAATGRFSQDQFTVNMADFTKGAGRGGGGGQPPPEGGAQPSSGAGSSGGGSGGRGPRPGKESTHRQEWAERQERARNSGSYERMRDDADDRRGR